MLWQPLSEHPPGECSCQYCREDDKTNDKWIVHDQIQALFSPLKRLGLQLDQRPKLNSPNEQSSHYDPPVPDTGHHPPVAGVHALFPRVFFSLSLAAQAAEMRP